MPPDTSQATSPFGNDTVDSLAAKIKAKYPAYNEMNNAQLVSQTINKYPVYQTHLSTEALQGLSAAPEQSFKSVLKTAIPGVLQSGGSLVGSAIAPSGDAQHQAQEQAMNPTGLDPIAGAANAALRLGRRVIAPQEQEQLAKAKQLYGQGQYSEAAGYAGSMAFPMVGPMATQTGEQFGQRQYGAGLATAGMIFAPEAAGHVIKAIKASRAVGAVRTGADAQLNTPTSSAPAQQVEPAVQGVSAQASTPATAPITTPTSIAPRTLEKFDPQKPISAIETPVQAASTPGQVPAALPTTVDYTKMSSGELAQGFGGADHDARMAEMVRRQAAARSAQTVTPQDQFVNGLGLKSVGTQNGLVNFEHPSHPGLSAAVPIADGLDANSIRSSMANRLEEFGKDPQYAGDTINQSVTGLRNRLPRPPVEPEVHPVAVAPSENAPQSPNYAYRSRDIGETGVPANSRSRSQATDSLSQAQGYLESRGMVTGKPQELIKIDLNRLDPNHYMSEPHPDGMNWYKFARPLEESEVEPVKSAGPDAIAEKALPAPNSAPAIQNAPTPEPVTFDKDDFNMRMASGEKWKSQIESKEVVGVQATRYADLLSRMRGALTDRLNEFKNGAAPDSQAHLDVRTEVQRLRDQAIEHRRVQVGDPLAKEGRGELAAGEPTKSPTGGIQIMGGTSHGTRGAISDLLARPMHTAWDDVQLLFRAKIRDAGGDPDAKLSEADQQVQISAITELRREQDAFKAKVKSLAQDFFDKNPSQSIDDKELTAGVQKASVRRILDEKDANGKTFTDRTRELNQIIARQPRSEVATHPVGIDPETGKETGGRGYLGKAKATFDDKGVLRHPADLPEFTEDYANKAWGKTFRKLPSLSKLGELADNLDKRADLLETVAKRIDAKRQTEAGAMSAASLGMASAGMATGAGIGHALAGAPGAVVGGAVGFVVGAVLPALYHPMLGVLDSLGKEIKGYGLDFANGTKDVTKSLVNFLAPKVGVDGKSLDAIYTMKGDIAASIKAASNVLDVYRKHLDKLGTPGQIDFIDRYKSGQQQVTPELQALADTIKQLDKENYDKITLFKPGTPFLDNHFRLLYKTLPGAAGATGFEGWLGKRPLAGSRGFLQQHVYNTLSDAMANGGVPVTTNPVDLFLLGHADVQRFIHANMLWEWAKNEGVANFQKNGTKPTPGYVPLDDRIAKVYFPAASGEGNINPGAYRVEEGFGRLMNNYLSQDYIRQNVLGKAIVDFKNVANGWSLIGGFHAFTINAAVLVQNLNIGAQRMFNLGIRQASGSDFAGGIKDLIKAPIELVRGNVPAYMEGKHLEEFGAAIDRYKRGDSSALKQFANSTSGQKFLQKYPGAEGLLGDAFQGGLNMRMSDDLRSNITKNMLQAIQDKKYVGATLRVPGVALYEGMNKPLFDYYIPRVKLGMFLRDMSQQLKDRAPDILNGSLTREELARKVVNRTENVFGEMNFDNMFWNKTLKTSLQLFYRSVTWRLGTVLAEGTGIVGQGRELVNAAKAGTLPRLDPNFGFVAGSLVTLGITSAVMMKVMSGKNPSSIADLTHPDTGDKNDLGRPARLNVPGYGTEFMKLSTNPLKYMTSGRSGPIDQLMESWQNKDFYGKQISDPNDPMLKQFALRAFHALAPQIIMNENINRLRSQGASKGEAALGLLGFSTASKSIDQTPAELKAQEIAVRGIPAAGRTVDQITHSQAVTSVVTGIQNNRDISAPLAKGFTEGTMQPKDLESITKRLTTPFLAQKLEGSNVHMADVLSVYDLASADEKRQLVPIVIKHLSELSKMSPAIRDQMLPRVTSALQGK